MNNPKKKSNVNKSMIVRDSLTNISISDPDKDKEAVYPIKRSYRKDQSISFHY